MSITIQWDNDEKNIIRWDFDGRWTADQFCDAFQTGMTLTRGVAHSVYGLGVVCGMPPTNLVDLCPRLMAQWPDNLKVLILVGASGLMKDAFARMDRRSGRSRNRAPNIVFADSLPEAYEMITYLHLKEVYAQVS